MTKLQIDQNMRRDETTANTIAHAKSAESQKQHYSCKFKNSSDQTNSTAQKHGKTANANIQSGNKTGHAKLHYNHLNCLRREPVQRQSRIMVEWQSNNQKQRNVKEVRLMSFQSRIRSIPYHWENHHRTYQRDQIEIARKINTTIEQPEGKMQARLATLLHPVVPGKQNAVHQPKLMISALKTFTKMKIDMAK